MLIGLLVRLQRLVPGHTLAPKPLDAPKISARLPVMPKFIFRARWRGSKTNSFALKHVLAHYFFNNISSSTRITSFQLHPECGYRNDLQSPRGRPMPLTTI